MPVVSKDVVRAWTTAERRAYVVKRRLDGLNEVEIGYELGISQQRVSKIFHDAMASVVRQDVETMREIENARIDRMEAVVMGVIERHHVVVSNGKIMGRFRGVARDPDTNEVLRTEDGKAILLWDELQDDDPILRAVAQLKGLWERRAKLNGLDKPTKLQIQDGDETLDEEIEALVRDMKASGEVEIPGGAQHPG